MPCNSLNELTLNMQKLMKKMNSANVIGVLKFANTFEYLIAQLSSKN